MRVTVVEVSDGVGGRVRTDLVDGFRLDRGFQVLLTAYPAARRLLDYEALHLRRFLPGALVRHGDRFHRVSDPLRRPLDTLATLRAPVGGVADKARVAWLRHRLLAAEPAALLRAPEVTTEQRLQQLGFSEVMIERFFRPWFGSTLCDPDLRTSSRMFETLFRTFAAGDAAVPAAGMQAIPDQLAAQLPADTVHLGERVVRVGPDGVETDGGRCIRARAVVVATDGPTAAELTGVDHPGSQMTSAVWFAADEPPLDTPVLVLDGDGTGPASNAAAMSSVAPEYAPPGSSLVVAAVPGWRHDEGVDEGGDEGDGGGLQADVRVQLRSWFGAAVDGWRHLRTDRIEHALPSQSVPFSPKGRVRLDSGVYVCGDHRDTASIQGALYSGTRTSEMVAAELSH